MYRSCDGYQKNDDVFRERELLKPSNLPSLYRRKMLSMFDHQTLAIVRAKHETNFPAKKKCTSFFFTSYYYLAKFNLT